MAQNQFNAKKTWNENAILGLKQMFKQAIDDETAYFIEGQKYFFISTSNNSGECDCSFRGTEGDSSDNLLQSVFVANPKKLIFPDYSGNKIYNSLGNIMVNPHIGLLFIDIMTASRLRINGGAKIIDNKRIYNHIWPKALRYIEVDVKQVYSNCTKRIKESFQT
ncbi:MAG: pyridoxamine 5'-phosphate oxidase family protein [Pseudomonadota bacterium]